MGRPWFCKIDHEINGCRYHKTVSGSVTTVIPIKLRLWTHGAPSPALHMKPQAIKQVICSNCLLIQFYLFNCLISFRKTD